MTSIPQNPHKIHELKIWPQFFEAIISGRKRFEVRKNDRGFNVFDHLHLREWVPPEPSVNCGTIQPYYTGRWLLVEVTYMVCGSGEFGIAPGYCVLGIGIPVVGSKAGPERSEP